MAVSREDRLRSADDWNRTVKDCIGFEEARDLTRVSLILEGW